VDDLVAEKGDEASFSQALSEENQEKLKEILPLLQRDVQDQVRDADLLRDALELIDLPADIKASLEPVSQLDNHFAAIKQALKNQSSQPALEQRRAMAKQSGCKCYILRKGSRLFKFQSKCDEGFLLGYSSNSKAYRVYNKSKGFVEEAYDVQFDETMGSQDDKENLDDVRCEELSKAMKTMAIGDIMPRKEEDDEGP
jgi:hypothetical protein